MANEYGSYANALTLAAREQTNFNPDSQSWTYTNGNLTFEHTASGGDAMFPFSQPMQPGSKYHFEFTTNSFHSSVYAAFAFFLMPVVEYQQTSNPIVNSGSKTFVATLSKSGGSGSNSAKFNTSSLTAPSNRPTTGSRITIEVDMSTVGSTTVRLYFNGSLDTTWSSLAFTDTPYYVGTLTGTETDRNGVFSVNFGQTAFSDTVTDGYIRLNTASMSEPTIINPDDHFHSVVVDHDGSSTASTCTFNLDTYEWLAIIKNTTGAVEKWYWIDSLNGVNKYWSSDASTALTTDANVLTVSGNQFTLGSTLGAKNYLVEIHKAGLASAAASNEDGSINTTATSFNATSGFTMGVFEGTATNATIGTGLSTAVEFLAVKSNDAGEPWRNWHKDLTDGTYYLKFDNTTAQSVEAATWNSTAPAATVFSVGTVANVNGNSQTVTYYGWHGVDGYSVFGKYEGNSAADGPMITTNFSAGSSFFKPIDATDAWSLYPPVLSAGNPDNRLAFNNTALPATDRPLDTLSNGLKVRTSNGVINPSSTVIYGAWGGRPMTDGSTNQGRAR